MAADKKAINVLSIGGTDPCSFSGLTVDYKTFLSLGVTGSFVPAVITAQNTRKFVAFASVSGPLIQKQLQALFEEKSIVALKTGLIPSPTAIQVVGEACRTLAAPLVVDPVLGSTTGRAFASQSVLEAYRRILIPLARIVTPNLHEAALLTGRKIETTAQIKAAAKHIFDLGTGAVLIKGGHRRGQPTDLLWDGIEFTSFKGQRIGASSWRGLGCTLSAALTAFLAQGTELIPAIQSAKTYVMKAMLNAITFNTTPALCHPVDRLSTEV